MNTDQVTLDYHTENPQPFDSIGLFTYLRTYARRHDENDANSTIENWKECITRVVNASNTQLGVGFTADERQELFDYLYNLKGSVAGRFLWQLGTKTVDQLGLMSLQNCAFTKIDHPVNPFVWIMNFLMLGAGCGYRILPEDLEKIPDIKNVTVTRIDSKDSDFIVPDSRQGWNKLLSKVLKAHFYSGVGFSYSCQLLRSKGALIKGFGGVASGPDTLCEGIADINKLLNENSGKKMSSVVALDVCNIIGRVVVSGNVRRSAQICLGDAKDTAYLNAKRYDLGNVPNYRCYSNNSVICNDINELLDNTEFWDGYLAGGEPYGIGNIDLCRKIGRLGETQYPDPSVEGFNPCVTGDTVVYTEHGPRQIVDIVGEQMNLYVDGQLHSTDERGFYMTGTRQVCMLSTVEGFTLRATPDHKIMKTTGEWVAIKDLRVDDKVRIHNHKTSKYYEVSGTDYYAKSRAQLQSNQLCYLRHGWVYHIVDDGEGPSMVKAVENYYATVSGVTMEGFENVYDCTVPTIHAFDANGFYVHNCAEQTLADKETCCLAEIYLPNIKTEDELHRVARYLYRVCKHSLALKCADSKETEEIVHRNMRMGIGVTGYLQATVQRGWLDGCYKMLRAFDVEYSKTHNFPISIKLTTVKPSGSLSLLGHTTSGCHPAFARYMLRRIRVSSESKLIKLAQEHGFPIEYQLRYDGTIDYTTKIISFPYSYTEDTILAENCTAIQQLEYVKELQTTWSDNSISVTVYFRKEELPAIKAWLKENYNNSVKSISFLLHNEHGFVQAPLEKITKEQYDELVRNTTPFTSVEGICHNSKDDEFIGQGECDGGACPIR
jgi:ribonucleotide reductase alpha subunit